MKTTVRHLRRWAHYRTGRRVFTAVGIEVVVLALACLPTPARPVFIGMAIPNGFIAAMSLWCFRAVYRPAARQQVLYDELCALLGEKVQPGASVWIDTTHDGPVWVASCCPDTQSASVFGQMTRFPGGFHNLPVHEGGKDTGERLLLPRTSLVIDKDAPTVRSVPGVVSMARIDGVLTVDTPPEPTGFRTFLNGLLAENQGLAYAENWEITEALDALVTAPDPED